ncbi:MAG: hypothetical protein M0Z87_07355 [Actinomycetota bacterium]|nr:hypothetical protein [Actinomycetota bacterium]
MTVVRTILTVRHGWTDVLFVAGSPAQDIKHPTPFRHRTHMEERQTVTSRPCPVCRQSSMVQISLTVASSPVLMESCSYCDSRRWSAGGAPAALSQVLELASAGRR